MIVKNGAVEFSDVDMRFVEKFGIFKATEMVLDFHNLNKTPFIYDTYQLASFLGYGRRLMFLVTKDPESHYFPTEIPKRDGTARKLLIPDTLIMSMQRLEAFKAFEVCHGICAQNQHQAERTAAYRQKIYIKDRYFRLFWQYPV